MKELYILCMLLIYQLADGQVVLYSESFETDGEGTRYTTNTYSDCGVNNPDYFLRTNTNPALPAGCTNGHGTALTNLQGSFYWASEDIRSASGNPVCGRPPGDITTFPINITNHNALEVSLFLATSNVNNVRWESNDIINVQASINNGAFITVGRFMGSALAGGNLRIDRNLDGVLTSPADDPATNVDVINFTKYNFPIPGTGTTMRVKILYDQCGGTEELGTDLIEVRGTFSPLAVKLIDFNVKNNIKNQAEINWAVEDEAVVSYFEIEKSDNAELFKSIGKVFSENNKSFQFIDNEVNNEMSYYRVKSIEPNGEISYSKILALQSKEFTIKSAKIFPNPVNEIIQIEFENNNLGKMNIVVLDTKGSVVLVKNNLQINKQNQIELDSKMINSGIYFINFFTENGEIFALKKIVKK